MLFSWALLIARLESVTKLAKIGVRSSERGTVRVLLFAHSLNKRPLAPSRPWHSPLTGPIGGGILHISPLTFLPCFIYSLFLFRILIISCFFVYFRARSRTQENLLHSLCLSVSLSFSFSSLYSWWAAPPSYRFANCNHRQLILLRFRFFTNPSTGIFHRLLLLQHALFQFVLALTPSRPFAQIPSP